MFDEAIVVGEVVAVGAVLLLPGALLHRGQHVVQVESLVRLAHRVVSSWKHRWRYKKQFFVKYEKEYDYDWVLKKKNGQ